MWRAESQAVAARRAARPRSLVRPRGSSESREGLGVIVAAGWSDYERYVIRKANPEVKSLTEIDGSEGAASLELIQYLNLLHPDKPDSIMLLCVWNTWQPVIKSVKLDTAFFVVYKSKKGGSAE